MPELIDENGNPVNSLQLSPEEEKQLEELEKIMKKPEIQNICGILLLIWRLYAVARADLVHRGNGSIGDFEVQNIMQALNASAMSHIDLKSLKKEVKRTLLPYVSKLSTIGLYKETEDARTKKSDT